MAFSLRATVRKRIVNATELSWTKSHKRQLSGRVKALKPFDPYHSPFCTCAPKLTLNVYNGCGGECFYCYTSSYAFGRWGYESDAWGPRKNVVDDLASDLRRIATDESLAELRPLPVVVSLSSDPYPQTPRVDESKLLLIRRCLQMLSEAGAPVLLQTKSDLFVRDLDVLDPRSTVIGVTITTASGALAARIEPHCPPPSARFAALREATGRGFSTLCRIDPVIPGVNDDDAGLRDLIERIASIGVRHVVSSTFKKRTDSAARFARLLPDEAVQSDHLYERTESAGYRYIKAEHRRDVMQHVRDVAISAGMTFSCCREGFPDLNAGTCDGQHLLGKQGA